jgi:NADH-ubiquinone oxidoreductase chain 2
LIILFIIIGSVLLISSSDLISIFLSIELQSYGLYLLCAVYRNSESSTSASLTYFLLGGLASCFILLGIGLIYANLGITSLDNFYIINNLFNVINEQNLNKFIYYIPYYLVIIAVGLLFKISAAPFHF